jgi:3-hydroxyacyl-[acyl-carrier-protein] dehydratase
MRLLLYDRITGLEPGQSITGVKTFSLSDEWLRKHFSKTAIVPSVMYIEAMAQLLGWLIIHTHDFRLSAAMSLIEGVTLAPDLRPGFTAEISGRIISTSSSDSLGSARISVDGREIASMNRIIYVHSSKVDQAQLRHMFHYYGGWNGAENA